MATCRGLMATLALGFLASSAVSAEAPARHGGRAASGQVGAAFVHVSMHGRTTISASFGNTAIVATMLTHEVAIGSPDVAPPLHRTNACTYSHMPCSLVDSLEIHVGGREIDLPRSVFADWSDVSTMRLAQVLPGRYRLKVDGGDASEGYWADVTFDKERVLERTRTWAEGMQVEERTVYYKLKPLE